MLFDFFYPSSKHVVASVQERMILSQFFTQLLHSFCFLVVDRYLTECTLQAVCLYPSCGIVPQLSLYLWLCGSSIPATPLDSMFCYISSAQVKTRNISSNKRAFLKANICISYTMNILGTYSSCICYIPEPV